MPRASLVLLRFDDPMKFYNELLTIYFFIQKFYYILHKFPFENHEYFSHKTREN